MTATMKMRTTVVVVDECNDDKDNDSDNCGNIEWDDDDNNGAAASLAFHCSLFPLSFYLTGPFTCVFSMTLINQYH